MAEQPTPEELIRQKLAQMLAAGKVPGPAGAAGATPPFTGAGTGQPAPGTGAAANAGNDPSKPAPPTVTATTPEKQPAMTGAAAGSVQPKPFQTDEEWAKANPGAAPPAPLDYKRPSLASGLAHGLAFGAMGFGHPEIGARAEEEWSKGIESQTEAAKTAKQQFPVTLHQAREKEEMGAANLAEKQATTAETQKRTELMGKSPVPQTTREALESQYRDQIQKKDQNGANLTLDMMTRLYPKDFKDADAAEMAKIPPQVLTQSGPKPVTPVWSAPGEAPITYNSTQEAQAAWGKKVQELQLKATSPEGKIDPIIESQIGPQPLREHYAQGPAGDKPFADANKLWGTQAEKIKNDMAEAAAAKRGESFGRNRPVEVLDTWNQNRPIRVSAGEAEDNPGRYVNAAGGAQAVKGGVTLDDITGALNNVKLTSHVLDGGTINRGLIAAVLADPESTAGTFMQSAPAAQLSPQEQDYVVALLTAREVIPGLRGILGAGSATDARVKLMLSTLPGAQTPSSDYAAKQIDSQLKTVERVRPSILNVAPQGKGGETKTEPGKAKGGFADWDKEHPQTQTK
jgi:hypothetical protein